MIVTIILLLILLCVCGFVVRLLNQGTKQSIPTSLPVSAKKYFFSRAEREFYETLKKALPAGYAAFPNVRLQDIFYVTAKDERGGVYARFRDKHVDFLIVEARSYRPVLGIELDGKSHERAEQKYRDKVKQVVFKSAGLPLLRFRNEEKLSPSALAVALGAYL